jgi:hypothetical protein
VLSAPSVSLWLQSTISLFVGPLLVLVGMILLIGVWLMVQNVFL